MLDPPKCDWIEWTDWIDFEEREYQTRRVLLACCGTSVTSQTIALTRSRPTPSTSRVVVSLKKSAAETTACFPLLLTYLSALSFPCGNSKISKGKSIEPFEKTDRASGKPARNDETGLV
jgi:hypothetical protein